MRLHRDCYSVIAIVFIPMRDGVCYQGPGKVICVGVCSGGSRLLMGLGHHEP